MRIAIVTAGIAPYVLGGMERHSFYLCKYLLELDIEVKLFHSVPKNFVIPTTHEVFSQFKINDPDGKIEKRFDSKCFIFPKGVAFPGHYLWESYKHSKNIYSSILEDQEQFDFIYCKGFSGWELSRKNTLIPIGVNFHGYEMFQSPPSLKSKLSQPLLRFAVEQICGNSDFVFSYGGKLTKLIQRKIGVKQSKIIEIASGIERNKLRDEPILEKTSPLKFAYLGRFERRKGVEEIASALKKFANESWLEFHFIGPIPASKRIKQSNVVYQGLISSPEVLCSKLDEMDVLVCPSYSEGFPNVIMEAMARGLLIITTDVGAISLLVDSSNGIVITPGRINELIEAFNKVHYLNKDALITMKQRSLEKIENFVWPIPASILLNEIKTKR